MAYEQVVSAAKKIISDASDNRHYDILYELENDVVIKKNPLMRIFWVAIIFMVADMFIFGGMKTWSAPVVIGFLQIIILLVMGIRQGLTDFSKLFNGAIALLGRKENKPKE